MIIKEKDFEMVQLRDGPFFDLSMLVSVNAGKSNERSEMKVVGNGMTFDSCIRYIVSARLTAQESEVSLSDFISKYAEEVNKIKNLINKK